jgi:hypothetical protein
MPQLDGRLSKIFARVRGTRRHGYLRSPADSRQHSAEAKYGLPQVVIPSKFTLRDSLKSSVVLPYDQSSSASCVSNGGCGLVVVAEAARGIFLEPGEEPSRLDGYFNARKNAPDRPVNVTDDGCYPSAWAGGMQKLGICREKVWPFDLSKVNAQPSWGARRDAYPRTGAHYSFIQSEGDARVRAIQAMIFSQKLPVGIGTQIGESYEDPSGPDIVDVPLNEQLVGGHFQAIVGYETTQNGVLFDVLGSWGRSFRDGGFVQFTADYVKWALSGDFLVIDGWSRLR